MPEMPVFLANVLEPRFARATHVVEVEDLAPRLRRVRFAGEALRRVAFRPGQEVEFRVSDRAFRHYSPSSFDAAHGAFDVVFFTHGGGPGSTWAATLQRGQYAGALGPGGGFALREARRHVLLGDETALGVFACMAQAAPTEILGAVEVAPGNQGWPQAVGLALPAVVRTADRGDALLRWLRDSALTATDDTCFYLVGHSASIVRLRAELLQAGWARRCIRTKAYWADGKRGL